MPPATPAAPVAVAPHSRASPWLLLTLAPFFWACNWIVGRGLHDDVPPLAMTFYRWLFALIILTPFALPRVVREWPLIRRGLRALVPLGIVGIAAHNVLAYVGLNYTTATNGVILNSFIPVMIVALSFLCLRERLSRLQVAGIAVSLTGVLTILSHGSLAALLAFRVNAGDLLVMVSMLLWSLYTIGLRWRPAGLSLLAFLYSIVVVGMLAVLPLYLAESALGRAVTWSAGNVAAIAGVSLFSSVLAYIFWNRGVEQVGASVAGLFIHLMPVFGVLLAALFLGEQLHAFHVGGIALILGGIWLTTRKAAVVALDSAG
jgi:drug/metabolite transporter (DMT)-like permease